MATAAYSNGSARARRTAGRGEIAALCLIALMSAGCANSVSRGAAVTDSAGVPLSPLIPNKALQLSPGLSLSVENILLLPLVYWAVDPLAPNWQLTQTPLGADRVRISLRKKRFTSGGDGEAAQLFARRAEQLTREGGYAMYALIEYTEGIESNLPIAQRVAQGVIELRR